MTKILVTGSSGLIGSEIARYFDRQAGPLIAQAGASLELYLPLSETKTRF